MPQPPSTPRPPGWTKIARPGFSVIAFLALDLMGCGAGEGAAQPGPNPSPTRVEVAIAREARVARPIDAVGVTAHRSQRSLAFETGGRIAEIRVDVGDRVAAGDVLATLDAEAIRARVLQAEARFEKAERDASRAEALERSGSVPTRSAEDATTAVELARGSLRLARHQLAASRISAPHEGRVVARLADPRETVTPLSPVVLLSGDADGRVVRVGLVDRDVVRVSLGDEATVRVDALPEAQLAGRVAEIAELPSPATGTFEVEIALGEDDATEMRVGLVARARITPSSGSTRVLVPAEALLEAEGERGAVFVVTEDGRCVERRVVEVADLVGADVAIRRGLRDGERVVLRGLTALGDGAPIEVVGVEEALP